MFRLVVEPTHLKNMRKSNWVHLPQVGMKIKNIWNQHLVNVSAVSLVCVFSHPLSELPKFEPDDLNVSAILGRDSFTKLGATWSMSLTVGQALLEVPTATAFVQNMISTLPPIIMVQWKIAHLETSHTSSRTPFSTEPWFWEEEQNIPVP